MRKVLLAVLFVVFAASLASARSVVFWQEGFPTVASQPVSRDVLQKALEGMDPVFAGADGLKDPATLANTELLVLPYGSAFPAEAWASIHAYLRAGGNLVIMGGQPFRVPVRVVDGKFVPGAEQDAYARELDFRNSYEVPPVQGARFGWKTGYSFFSALGVRARRLFTVEGSVDGLGYMVDAGGTETAAPVVVSNHLTAPTSGTDLLGVRIVLLDFDPQPGYWDSPDGVMLIRHAADYARQGATSFWTELLFSTLKPGDPAQMVVHLRNARRERLGLPQIGSVKLELLSGTSVLDTARVQCGGRSTDLNVEFRKNLQPGFYTIRAIYEDGGKAREFSQNGFWVEDEKLLTSGPVLGVKGDYLTRDGKPFFPFGTNYFSTEANGWDFSGPRNAWIWERDFADMERNGVTFVRTGIWMSYQKVLNPLSEIVTERFARNLEAFLLSARRHNIAVNFTFFAFAPGAGPGGVNPTERNVPNPYMDAAAIRAQQDYVLSIVNRFKNSPWICWDLINEPTFSNPRRLWRGNAPNGDPVEVAAWHDWLRKKYGTLEALATAWAVTPEKLGSFDSVPEPSDSDFGQTLFDRYGNGSRVRAVDYNLFAQEMFSNWVQTMIATIRSTGTTQLINVGQDEGGVTDRVLNQFYAESGVSFTTNHTYWRDDALLWDSVV